MQIHKLKDVTMIPQGNESLVKCREREKRRKEHPVFAEN